MKLSYICKLANLFYKIAVDPVATNRTVSDKFPEGLFSSKDTPETYLLKLIPLYSNDIRAVNFNKFKNFFLRKGLSEEEAVQETENKIRQIATKQAEKSVRSHMEFLKHLNLPEGSEIISPGSGVGSENVIAPQYIWHGLEYQPNSVSLFNDRNRQMGLPGRAQVWSAFKGNPEDPIQEDLESSISDFPEVTLNAKGLYAKHACGGVTDAAMMRACQNKVPEILLATCCANRYTEASFKILNPTNPNGSLMSYKDYDELARISKSQDEKGKEAVRVIDGFREKYLINQGYQVTRGETSYGPFIRARL